MEKNRLHELQGQMLAVTIAIRALLTASPQAVASLRQHLEHLEVLFLNSSLSEDCLSAFQAELRSFVGNPPPTS